MTEKEKNGVLNLRMMIGDPKGILIPKGLNDQLTIQIIDGLALYYFKNRRYTKNFAMVEILGDKKKGLKQTTFFSERTGKAHRVYEGKTKEEIRDLILSQLNQLKKNVK